MSVEPSVINVRAVSAEMKIRPAAVGDLAAMREISNWAICNTVASFRTEPETLEHWRKTWDDRCENFPWFVAESNGVVIGFATSSSFAGRCGSRHTAEVSVYVHPDCRGRGVGRALYGVLLPTLRAQGYRTLVAEIAVPNPASDRLHQAFGFERAGTLERVGWKLGEWHDLVYWQSVLDDGDEEPQPVKPWRSVLDDVTREL